MEISSRTIFPGEKVCRRPGRKRSNCISEETVEAYESPVVLEGTCKIEKVSFFIDDNIYIYSKLFHLYRSRTNLNLSDTVQMQNLVSPLSPNSSQSSSSTSEQKFWYSEPEICLNEYDKEVLPESPADSSVGTRLPMDIKSRQSVPSTSSQSSDFIVDANDREVKQFLASATSSPFLESPLRPKKIKLQEETAVMFGNALENILERTQQSRQSTLEDTDSLIAKNVEYCLKTLPTNELKIKFRKKFRNLIEECEETILFHAPTGK